MLLPVATFQNQDQSPPEPADSQAVSLELTPGPLGPVVHGDERVGDVSLYVRAVLFGVLFSPGRRGSDRGEEAG